MSEIDQKKTAERIRQLRKERGWTQKQLSEKIEGGLKGNYISSIENCKENIGSVFIRRLMKAFNLKFDDIAVYKKTDTDTKLFYDVIQGTMWYYENKFGLLHGTSMPLTDIGEIMNAHPNCGVSQLVRIALQMQGYIVRTCESKMNNNVAIITIGENNIEYDLSKYPSRIKKLFMDDYVYIIMKDQNIVAIISEESINDIESFIYSGIKGIMDGKRQDFNLLTEKVNLSEEEMAQIVKIKKNVAKQSERLCLEQTVKSIDYMTKQIEERYDKLIEKHKKIVAERDKLKTKFDNLLTEYDKLIAKYDKVKAENNE